jgi:hypothetical protein
LEKAADLPIVGADTSIADTSIEDKAGHDTRAKLEALVRNFDRDAIGNGKSIRDLVEKNRGEFCSAALAILREQDQSRGAQYLLSTLVGKNLFLEALTHPSLTQEQAIALARAASNVCSMLDVTLAKHLAETVISGRGSARSADLQRLTEVLCKISNGARLLPSLMALAREPNPYQQSKAVLMIGRASRSVKWVQTRLANPDPRVRANAVEALWTLDTPETRGLLEAAVDDPNNRVAGNALLGLYRLGDAASTQALIKASEHESWRFRATAAWVMGETGDPRFTKTLARLLGEPNGPVRARAFEALGRIRAAVTRSRHGLEWRVSGKVSGGVQPDEWRCLLASVKSQDGREDVRLLPTQFILSEDGQPVYEYEVEDRPVAETLAVSFVLPRTTEPDKAPGNRSALAALRWKRPSDQWSLAPYLSSRKDPQVESEENIGTLDAPVAGTESLAHHFTSDAETAAANFRKVYSRMECSDLWGAIRRAVQVESGPARGQRHVLVYSQNVNGQAPGYAEIASSSRASGTIVHAVSLAPNPNLENLCQLTQGTFQIAASEQEVAGLIDQACLKLTAGYTIRYKPVVPRATLVTLRVQSPAGWAEVEIPVQQ